MLRNYNIAVRQVRLETFVHLDTPRALLESLILVLAVLHGRSMLPPSDEAELLLLVQAVVDGDFVCSGGSNELLQMRDGICFFETLSYHAIDFAFRVQEVVVWVDDDDGGVGRCGRHV